VRKQQLQLIVIFQDSFGIAEKEKIKKDSNIWISDTVAIFHRVANSEQTTMGNGTHEDVKEVADIRGTIKKLIQPIQNHSKERMEFHRKQRIHHN
jgi:hypothetical protein